MINPSVHGWIEKFLSREKALSVMSFGAIGDFYMEVRASGFIYGHVVSLLTAQPISRQGWTGTETSKMGLLCILFQLHKTKERNAEYFLSDALAFYRQLNTDTSFFSKILPGGPASQQLERIIDDRVQTNENLISKSFSHIVTNALLFMDVLAFEKYLSQGSLPEKYIKRTEEILIGTTAEALRTKQRKSAYDSLLIKLFESSVRYSKFSERTQSPQAQTLAQLGLLDKYYLIDLTAMALWSDAVIEPQEQAYLLQLTEALQLPTAMGKASLEHANRFISTHKNDIHYFNYSNPVKHFYDQMTQNVVLLITRNRTRLGCEIRQSGELMRLLAASTRRDLDKSEKKKVRKQLLDICKTIPSLTIFLLPGGSLLLPILIKFIPQLLPSAFNENTESD